MQAMFETLQFMVIEDKDTDRNEVLDRLADVDFVGDNLLATPATYNDAKEDLERHYKDLDVVFLDLNLPESENDAFPERGHGRRLLEMIHSDLNRRPGSDIKVIIVSGEDLLDGWNDKNLYEAFPSTLVSICQKTALDKTLKASFKRLKRDPLLSRIKKAGIDIVDDYKTLVSSGVGIETRLESARRIAVRLVRNEVDCFFDDPLKSVDFSDDLSSLIHRCVESRFRSDAGDRPRVKEKGLKQGRWEDFLWRGAMVQHFYTINSYRNIFIHMKEQAYRTGNGGIWQPDRESLDRCEEGVVVGKAIGDIVREIIEWYLPWHEKVYLPWKASKHS